MQIGRKIDLVGAEQFGGVPTPPGIEFIEGFGHDCQVGAGLSIIEPQQYVAGVYAITVADQQFADNAPVGC